MDADVRRQRMYNAPDKLVGDSHSSIGSLPRGEINIRQDSIVITSTNRASDFPVGAPERTQEIPRTIIEKGLRKFEERNAQHVTRRANTAFNISARNATFTPDALKSTDKASEATRVTTDASFADNTTHLMNPSNRLT